MEKDKIIDWKKSPSYHKGERIILNGHLYEVAATTADNLKENYIDPEEDARIAALFKRFYETISDEKIHNFWEDDTWQKELWDSLNRDET